MLPEIARYKIWPRVVPADQLSVMTIVPSARSFLLLEGETYEIAIIDVDADNDYYKDNQPQHKFTATAHGGVLSFTFAFEGEMSHDLLFFYNNKLIGEFTVYSLYEDLYALRPCKGDFHMHTFRSDGANDPAELLATCREMGYDFAAITDHNRFYPGEEAEDAYAGVRLGICRFPGEEIHTPGSPLHIVHVGGETSVAEQYVQDIAKYEREVEKYKKELPKEIPEKYRERYAMAHWAVDKIHEAGGLAIFAHPFWKPSSRMHNVCSEFSRILLNSGMFDGFEVLGVYLYPAVANLTVSLWQELRAEGLKITPIGSSDVHNTTNDRAFPYHYTICFAEANETGALKNAIQKGMTVAVRATPRNIHDSYEYNCYGSFRLIAYAHFLLKEYFPSRQRICQCEGIAMRQYAIGETDASLIETLSKQSEAFSDRFFGRLAPVLPTQEMLEFEERWRDVQRSGPVTKGGLAMGDTITRQI